MDRLDRFSKNAGLVGCLQCVVIGLFLIFSLNRDVASGLLLLSLPLLGGAVAVAVILRESIYKHFETMRGAMNGVAIIGVICAVTLSNSESVVGPWLPLLIRTIMAAYVATYFIMLSDHRIGRLD